jgi:hypothetical protein
MAVSLSNSAGTVTARRWCQTLRIESSEQLLAWSSTAQCDSACYLKEPAYSQANAFRSKHRLTCWYRLYCHLSAAHMCRHKQQKPISAAALPRPGCKKQTVCLRASVSCRSPAHLTGKPMLCCGVCQYEGRHCAVMAPPGAMDAHLADYRQQGFDFAGFSPEELWTRIRGERR